MMDMIIGRLREHIDIDNLAAKVGIPAGQVEKAVATLAQEHAQPGDTVTTAASRTGIDTSVMAQIMEQVGGEGSIAGYAQMLGLGGSGGIGGALDRDGDGNPVNDIVNMAGGLFGKK